MAMMDYDVGEYSSEAGNITDLDAVAGNPPDIIARNIGMATFRFRQGHYVLVLRQMLTADDFIFEGITLRSGGGEGLPLADPDANRARPSVHKRIQNEYGDDDYRRMRERALDSVTYAGPRRLVRVVPVIGHVSALGSDLQYPPGQLYRQWRLIQPCNFQVVLFADENGVCETLDTSLKAQIGPNATYDERARIAQYLARV